MYTECDNCKWMSGGTESGFCQKKHEYVLVDGCSEGETWKQALERHRENPKIEKYLNELRKKDKK